MVTNGINAFLLISIGAGFFVFSIIKGLKGKLKQSIFFAFLAFFAGVAKAIDDGLYYRSDAEIVSIIFCYALLSLFGVMISHRMHRASPKENG